MKALPAIGRPIEFATAHTVYRGTYSEHTNGNHVTSLFFRPDDSFLLFRQEDVKSWYYLD